MEVTALKTIEQASYTVKRVLRDQHREGGKAVSKRERSHDAS